MTLGTTNITTTLVGSVLKIASRDIRGLCTASTINKWSFRKPIKIATTTAITDTDVWSVNGGFNIPIYTNPVILLNQKNSGANWEYVKPIGGSSSPYRIGDFRGYSHDATDWFEFLLYNNNILQGNTVTITLPSLTSLFNFDQFKLLSSNLRLGFIIAQNKSIGNTSINYYPVTGSSYPLILDLSE